MASVKRLWKEQDGKCGFCGCETQLPKSGKIHWTLATVEHIIPKSKGGTNHRSNLMMSCYKCNSTRGAMDAQMWHTIVNDKKRLSAFYRARSISKTLTKIRKLARRRIKLAKKYGADHFHVQRIHHQLINMGVVR